MTTIEPFKRESPKTFLTACPWCNEGIFNTEGHCGNCGAEETYDDCPVVLGGQGKSSEEIVSTGTSWGWIVLAMLLCVVGGMILGAVVS